MAHEVASFFTKYELSKEEELAAVQFTDIQRMYLQNIIAESAEEKVRLTYDPTNPHLFLQREAELQGIILTLSSVLAKANELMEETKTEV